MRFEEIRELLGDIPFISPERGHVLYQHIRQHKPQHVLELGIGHGVSSCYMAAALHENGAGHLTCVDLIDAAFSPSAEELVSRANLTSFVSVVREKSSYTWYLKNLIEKRTPAGGICEPQFDFCFIDGPKNWTIDGAAFFMVDKLMKAGGWIIFDDYDWTYNSVYDPKTGGTSCDGINIPELAEDERTQPHIEAIFRLLVTQHPNYGAFRIDGNTWAWAQKVQSNDRKISLTYTPDFRYSFFSRLRSLYKRFRLS
ncbi:O-methyltransferase [Bradyrhizobium sacchari]|uniref:Putative O-methyltransferase YrrM n=1 Tax=Bradyrhizobium sacchari TaxID=1399419 RepID=A0A560JA43_9BRAD|nr:class I SAM-dependent methyltransferase [Bradyrhizobium sacchari]TWB67359.1 putative O-methyltransferase YrrM [Bradyrhizobium sacchari]TWB84596.1 putative O-methyltransferase YrrM [Bradyrhizobium sacchari]